MGVLWQDVVFGIRMLRKNPGFTAVAVLTLALGIGASTAIFSVVNGLLLHPAGIAHPERLAAIRVRYEKLDLKSIVISAPDFGFVRDNKQVFAAAAAETEGDFSFTGSNWPERMRGARVSWQWFDVFEAKPLLGRVFTPEEDQPKADHEVVLSYQTWKTHFGGDTSIVGRTIQLNQEPYQVIGVMRPEFQWPNPVDVWAPLALAPDDFAIDNIFNESFFVVARLQPSVPPAQAGAYLDILTQQVANDPRAGGYPKTSGWGMFAVPFTQFVYGDLRTPLFILLGAVGFVLLIACSNVAGLLLARASGRSKEFAVRTALGATPWRLARQTLTESVVLAAAGMVLGLVVTSDAIQALLSLAPESLSTVPPISMDLHVLLFTATVAGISALVLGTAPAWHIAKTNPQRNLKEGRGAGSDTEERHRFRSVLVIGELALALVLLAGAGVFLKSLSKLQDVNVGFRPHGLMTAAYSLPEQQYGTVEKQSEFCRAVLERLSSAPGVISAAVAVPLPFSGFGGSASFMIEGRPKPPGDPGPHGNIRIISPEYFSTLGVALLHGRTFTGQDRKGAEAVMVIDENLAHQYWPNDDPVGKRMRRNDNDPWATIIGVVAPVRHSQVVGEEASSEGIEGSGKGVYYYPLYQAEAPAAFLVARTVGNPASLAHTIREAVRSVDPHQPVSDMKTMDQRIALSMGPRRSVVTLLGVFAAMALALAAVGLFGLVRYNVTERTREIGIRIVLGASRSDILRMVLREGLRLACAGTAAGLLGAFALTRVLSSFLYGVGASDPLTLASVAALLVAVALFACYLPARRASKIDPMAALRYE
jgi:predicted permease